ncbi:MAG: sporulation protein YunB [Bacillota bacterium]|nr:sporulation protein YunB [Bacillota bacterium]
MLLFLGSILFFVLLETRFLPALKEISHSHCKATANEIIDTATMHQISALDAAELLIEKDGGYIANTVLVNHFCALLSKEITEALYFLPEEEILIPFGAATDLSIFANTGPDIPFSMLPVGNANVEYETEFTAAGINQINYKIWLDITIEIRVVNPFYQESVQMKRKCMLADLIYGGTVPEHYVQFTNQSEYLLTE